MKFKYCPSCGEAYSKTRFERDRCVGCGKKGTHIVNVKRNIFTYLAYVTFILGAAVIFIMKKEVLLRWILFAGFLIGGALLSVAGMKQMKIEAITKGKTEEKSKLPGHK